jgi:hypothetical protein
VDVLGKEATTSTARQHYPTESRWTMSKLKESKPVSRPDIGKAVKNADGELENPFNRVLQDTAYIFPLYPFRQGQTDARNLILVHRRDLDEYKRLLFKKTRLTKKEYKTFKRLAWEMACRDPLTEKELSVIEQTVGSYDMDVIGAFLMEHYHFTRTELNDRTWYQILHNLRSFLGLKQRRIKELQADLASTKPAEKEQKAPINVHMENVQAKNLQIGHDASIHEQQITEEKKKGIFIRLLKVIGAIVVAVIAAIVVDIFADFGWLQSIKAFIYNILWPK